MAYDLYGQKPGTFPTFSNEKQRQYAKRIFRTILEGNVLETACWANDVDPDDFEAARKTNPRLDHAVQRYLAVAETRMVKQMRTGGPAGQQAKMALEALKLTRKHWTPKTQVDFTRQFEDALKELKELLPEEHYATVIKTMARHA